MPREFKFDIKENLCVLAEGSKGWRKELNVVSWNEGEPKFDLRDWSPEHDKMGKGITLTSAELKVLKAYLATREF